MEIIPVKITDLTIGVDYPNMKFNMLQRGTFVAKVEGELNGIFTVNITFKSGDKVECEFSREKIFYKVEK